MVPNAEFNHGKSVFKKWNKISFLCLILFLLAVGVRIGAIVYLETHINPKGFDVHIVAENIVKGNGFSFPFAYVSETVPSSYKSPLYPFFMAFFLLFGKGSTVWFIIQTFQACLAGLTCLILVRIASLFFSKPVGFISGFVYAFYPPGIIIATRMHEINFTIPLLAWLILQLFKLNIKPSRSHALGAGIAMGFCLLAEPSFGFFCLMALLYFIFINSVNFKIRVNSVAIILISCFVILLPWSVRNLLVHKKVVFVKNVLGYNLWIGNNPRANGTDRIVLTGKEGADTIYMIETLNPKLMEKVKNASTEVERDHVFFQAAINYIRAHPKKVFLLALNKVWYLWGLNPTHPLAQNMLYKICQFTLFITGMIGLIVAFPRAKYFSRLLFILFGCQTIVYMAFFVLPRYRLVIDPYLILGCSILLMHLKVLGPSFIKTTGKNI